MSSVREVKRKPVSVVLADGKAHSIKFDLNGLAELEDLYGSIDAAFTALDNNSVKAARAVLWAGLLSENDALTLKEAGHLLDVETMQELMGSLSGALSADMPSPEDVATDATAIATATVSTPDPNV